jgi:hypothetical protein
MSYNIYYDGTVKIDKQLDDETYKIIMGLSQSSRMTWDTDKLERDGIAKKKDIGEGGEFFFGHDHMPYQELIEFEKKYAIYTNCPPGGQPQHMGIWIVTDDRKGLIWNEAPNSYGGHEWLQYLVKKILVPRGYNAGGTIDWITEEKMYDNVWHTIIKGKSVKKYRGRSEEQKERDLEHLRNEQPEEYDQQWLKKLITDEIEFLYDSIITGRYKKDLKSVSYFNLLIDSNIIEISYDGKCTFEANYLCKNVRLENKEIVYDKVYYDDKAITNEILLQMAKERVEKYISDNPNYFEESLYYIAE